MAEMRLWESLLALMVDLRNAGGLPSGKIIVGCHPDLLADLWSAILTINKEAPCETPYINVSVHESFPCELLYVYDLDTYERITRQCHNE